MLPLSSLVQFLMELLRGGDLAQDFSRDPQGTLADHGLAGTTAQDVQDVLPLLADQPGVTRCGTGGATHHGSAHHDPVTAIRHVQHDHEHDGHGAQHHQAAPVFTEYHTTYTTYDVTNYDSSVHAAQGATVVQDSFNTHNGGVDNTGGVIYGSTVGGESVAGSGNHSASTAVTGSFDDDHSTTATDVADHATTATVTGSANHADTSLVDSGTTDQSTHVHGDVLADHSVNGSYAVHDPAPVDAGHEAVGAEHTLV